jgi:hypothetical protein
MCKATANRAAGMSQFQYGGHYGKPFCRNEEETLPKGHSGKASGMDLWSFGFQSGNPANDAAATLVTPAGASQQIPNWSRVSCCGSTRIVGASDV